jgi:hypothetical protein
LSACDFSTPKTSSNPSFNNGPAAGAVVWAAAEAAMTADKQIAASADLHEVDDD